MGVWDPRTLGIHGRDVGEEGQSPFRCERNEKDSTSSRISKPDLAERSSKSFKFAWRVTTLQ